MSNLKPLYKKFIDNNINKLSNIKYIYGGQTLEQRQIQHERINNKFLNMNIKKIFKCLDKRQINLAETYLIEQLNNKYGNKCLNIAMIGGGGQRHSIGDHHILYIMYK